MNYPKLGIKWHVFMIIKFLWIKNEFGLGGCSGPGSLTKLQSLLSSFRRIHFLTYSVIGGGSGSSQVVLPGPQLCKSCWLFTDRPSIPCHTCLSIEHLTTWYLASSEQQRGKQRVWQKDGSHHLWGFHQSQKWHPITFAISCFFLLVWVWGNAHTLPADMSRHMKAKS